MTEMNRRGFLGRAAGSVAALSALSYARAAGQPNATTAVARSSSAARNPRNPACGRKKRRETAARASPGISRSEEVDVGMHGTSAARGLTRLPLVRQQLATPTRPIRIGWGAMRPAHPPTVRLVVHLAA